MDVDLDIKRVGESGTKINSLNTKDAIIWKSVNWFVKSIDWFQYDGNFDA